MPSSYGDYQLAIAYGDRVRRHDQAAVRLAGELIDVLRDLGNIARADHSHLHLERLRGCFDGASTPS